MLRVLHISDTHVLADYSVRHGGSVLNKVKPPRRNLARMLQWAAGWEPDVILHTGDITHEGDAAECEDIRDLFASSLPEVPVLFAKGNHDAPERFLKIFTGGPAAHYERFHKDYRFLVVDTATLHKADGAVTEAQEEWLAQKLKTPFGRGTILLGHHPLLCRQKWFSTRVGGRLMKIIRESDAVAYFCGHTHYAEVEMLPAGIPQVTAGSLAFGLDCTDTDMVFTDELSCNLCHVDGRHVTVGPRPFGKETQVFTVESFVKK